MSICFCGPGRLAAGSSDNLLRVWDLASQQLIKTFTGHTGTVAALACNERGQVLVSGGFDATVRVWQLKGLGVGQPVGHGEDEHLRSF